MKTFLNRIIMAFVLLGLLSQILLASHEVQGDEGFSAEAATCFLDEIDAIDLDMENLTISPPLSPKSFHRKKQSEKRVLQVVPQQVTPVKMAPQVLYLNASPKALKGLEADALKCLNEKLIPAMIAGENLGQVHGVSSAFVARVGLTEDENYLSMKLNKADRVVYSRHNGEVRIHYIGNYHKG